ncbi:MAG: hypothetical protein WCY82_01740 [Desulfotomaculaceae bacterium]
MNNDFKIKIEQITRGLPAIMRRIPGIVKIEGLQFIHENFQKEGFRDGKGGIKKWPKRKETKYTAKKNKGRNLLVDSSALRRSWDQETTEAPDRVSFTSSLPYAEPHNEGSRAGRGSGFNMPERKMIGESKTLDAMVEVKLNKLMDNLLK